MLSGLCFAQETNYLCYQSSSKAEIVKSRESHYTLTLQGDIDYVSYFSDRPARQTGVMKLEDFLKFWSDTDIQNNFAENPPNVAIVMVAENGQTHSAVATLTNPTRQPGHLAYQLRLLDSQPIPQGKLQHIALFFDDIHWNPGGFGK